ncbi:MAG: HD domain-containing protein [Treponema sp.]|nr:HD domain-containing protein [Treponema sp.]
MINKKSLHTVILIILCIVTNYVGKKIAMYFNLPLWLDSIGTIFSAYFLGPVCGAIIGFTSNAIYGINHNQLFAYSLTSVAIGLITGYEANKGRIHHVFGTLSTSVLVTIASVIISLPLNIIFSDGMTGNLWGDGVIEFFREFGLKNFFCILLGEFYIDFLDKTLSLTILHIAIKLKNARSQRATSKAAVALIIFTLLSFSKNTASLYAKEIESFIQTVYSNSNGLPCGEANDIEQSNDGILWIGTYAGLYRYNGNEMRWINEYDSIRNVNVIYKDTEGRLWIGTNDKGVSIMINETVSNIIDESKGLPSNSVRSITKDSNGLYYIGTSLYLQTISINNGLKIVSTIPEILYAVRLSADQNGRVAAITSKGELFILEDSRIILKTELNKDKEIFNCCAFDSDGNLFVGTSKNHIYKFSISPNRRGLNIAEEISDKNTTAVSSALILNQEKIFTIDELSFLNSLEFTNDGKFFVCSDNGIGYFDKDFCFHYINTDYFNNSIDNMAVDYQGNYWFSSSRQGVLRLSPTIITNLYNAISMPYKVVNSNCVYEGKLYIGTDSGLDIIDLKENVPVKNSVSEALNGIRIRCIKKDSNNHLWFCTYGKGIIEVKDEKIIKTYDSSNSFSGDWMRTLIELSDGTIVAAGDTGIVFIENQKTTKQIRYNEGLSNSMILTLMELPDRTILAGSDGEGIAVIKNRRVERILSPAEGLSSGVILRTVMQSNNEGVFIVTSNGLCYMDMTYKIRILPNFPYFNNYDIANNKNGTLFVSGSAGIYVVNENELVAGNSLLGYDLIDSKSGLDSALTANSWNYISEEGILYLSCGTGVYSINMNSYLGGKTSYRMQMSYIKLDNQTYQVPRGSTIKIPRNVTKVEFFPEIINFTAKDPTVSYELIGFDSKPTEFPQSELTSATYTKLSPGKYTFRISILDSKTREIIEQSNYSVIKEKNIYDNKYFIVYMILVAMIAIAWLTWYIVRTQLQRTLNFQRRELALAHEQVRIGNETILTIAKTVDARDENTSQHSTRVSQYSVLIGKELGLSKEECENLRKSALLHDIGKIGVPDVILNKPTTLTPEEYEVMKTHVTRGAEILKDFTMIEHVSDGVLYHHERWDGKGYAQGLKGEEIPLYGRIIGMADAFDAMTANRVYRSQMKYKDVLKEVKKGRGKQFDPQMVDILFKLLDEGKIDVTELYKDENY